MAAAVRVMYDELAVFVPSVKPVAPVPVCAVNVALVTTPVVAADELHVPLAASQNSNLIEPIDAAVGMVKSNLYAVVALGIDDVIVTLRAVSCAADACVDCNTGTTAIASAITAYETLFNNECVFVIWILCINSITYI